MVLTFCAVWAILTGYTELILKSVIPRFTNADSVLCWCAGGYLDHTSGTLLNFKENRNLQTIWWKIFVWKSKVNQLDLQQSDRTVCLIEWAVMLTDNQNLVIWPQRQRFNNKYSSVWIKKTPLCIFNVNVCLHAVKYEWSLSHLRVNVRGMRSDSLRLCVHAKNEQF